VLGVQLLSRRADFHQLSGSQARPEDEALVRGLGTESFVSRREHLANAVRALVRGGAGALDAGVASGVLF
jgi:hypothetical protein